MEKHRAIFLSDVHLGSGRTYADKLLRMLKTNPAERLVLVGDIVDFKVWQKRGIKFDQTELDLFLWLLNQINDNKTYVNWVMGNHEIQIRNLIQSHVKRIGSITCHSDFFNYISRFGDIFTVVHGDKLYKPGNPVWYKVGSAGYHLMTQVEKCCKRFNLPSVVPILQSLSSSKEYLDNVKQSAFNFAKNKKTDGIIYGHTHKANFDKIDGKMVVNLGCWTHKPCSYLCETSRGNWQLSFC